MVAVVVLLLASTLIASLDLYVRVRTTPPDRVYSVTGTLVRKFRTGEAEARATELAAGLVPTGTLGAGCAVEVRPDGDPPDSPPSAYDFPCDWYGWMPDGGRIEVSLAQARVRHLGLAVDADVPPRVTGVRLLP